MRAAVKSPDGKGSALACGEEWKRVELQKLADELGLNIIVLYLPPRTSKYNKIDGSTGSPSSLLIHLAQLALAAAHKLSHHRRTYRSYNIHGGTTVRCELDENLCPAGTKVSDGNMAKLNISRDDFHGEWNYTIKP